MGDQAWSDARLIRMSEQLAELEDVVDQVRELIGELRAEVDDDRPIDGQELLERLEGALSTEGA